MEKQIIQKTLEGKKAKDGYYNEKNILNNLTGKEWLFSTKSIIPKSYKSSFQLNLRNIQGGQKPPELCSQLIDIFTKKGQIVLDPFCGTGGILLGCYISKRKGIGIEINERWVNIYLKVCKLERIKPNKMILGDSRNILNTFEPDTFDLILTDPPYWEIDKFEKSKGKFKKFNRKSKENIKSKLSPFNEMSIKSKDEWKQLLKDVFIECYRVLKPNQYCVSFMGNIYHNNEYHLLNSDLTTILKEIGFKLKGEIIWYDTSKRLHIYGINYAWIPSIVHQFIMIYKKEG